MEHLQADSFLWILDQASMTCAFCSKSIRNILGYGNEEIQGAPLDTLFSQETMKKIQAAFGEVLSGGGDTDTLVIEAEHRHKNGGPVWMEIEAALQRDESGRPVSWIGVSRDLSRRTAVEEESRRLALVVRHSRELVNLATPDGRMFFLNDAGRRMLGLSEEKVPQTHILSVIPEHLRNKARQEILPCLQHNGYWEGELQYLNQETGDVTDVYAITFKIADPQTDALLYLANVSMDITDRKRMESQLLQAQKMEAVGRLAGGLAHDFNNMLSIIIGRVELAMMKMDQDHPLCKDFREIEAAAKRSADLIRQLMAFASKQTISPQLINLNTAVAGMLTMLRRLIGEDIEIRWQPAAGLWAVKMDLSQVDQILANLMVNARDAIRNVGRITIETANTVLAEADCTPHINCEPGPYVLLSVTDTGCGMSREILTNIFEPFFTTKSMGIGTGLGLSTVYGIVRQNNGQIQVHSVPDQGTTFRIYLPAHLGRETAAAVSSKSESVTGGTETILLVEDDLAMLQVLRTMLEKLGYRLFTAATPSEALHLAEKHGGELHLLITDMVMPEMNGRELADGMRRLFPNLKQLFMSGYTADAIAHHDVLREGVHFIQKPFSIKDFSAKIRAALASENEVATGDKP